MKICCLKVKMTDRFIRIQKFLAVYPKKITFGKNK